MFIFAFACFFAFFLFLQRIFESSTARKIHISYRCNSFFSIWGIVCSHGINGCYREEDVAYTAGACSDPRQDNFAIIPVSPLMWEVFIRRFPLIIAKDEPHKGHQKGAFIRPSSWRTVLIKSVYGRLPEFPALFHKIEDPTIHFVIKIPRLLGVGTPMSGRHPDSMSYERAPAIEDRFVEMVHDTLKLLLVKLVPRPSIWDFRIANDGKNDVARKVWLIVVQHYGEGS